MLLQTKQWEEKRGEKQAWQFCEEEEEEEEKEEEAQEKQWINFSDK